MKNGIYEFSCRDNSNQIDGYFHIYDDKNDTEIILKIKDVFEEIKNSYNIISENKLELGDPKNTSSRGGYYNNNAKKSMWRI